MRRLKTSVELVLGTDEYARSTANFNKFFCLEIVLPSSDGRLGYSPSKLIVNPLSLSFEGNH